MVVFEVCFLLFGVFVVAIVVYVDVDGSSVGSVI